MKTQLQFIVIINLVRLSALSTVRLYPQETFLVLISVVVRVAQSV